MQPLHIALPLLIVASQTLAQNSLLIEADPGASPVSTSQSLSYSAGEITATASGSGVRLSAPSGINPRWSLTLRPPGNAPFVAGCYERAKRFADQGRPEIDFSFGSSGCSNAFGRFNVLDVDRDLEGDVTSMAVDFALQCEQYGKAVQGKVRFNSAVPTTGPNHQSVTTQSGVFSFDAAAGAVGGGVPGGSASFQLSRQTTIGRGNFDNGASFIYAGPAPGSGNVNWHVDFAAPGDVPIAVGSYPNATRYPFQAATDAGLAFGYGGAGCNTLDGNFVVTDVLMDGLDVFPVTFEAGFEQRCPNQSGPLSSGVIMFAANVIGPTEFPSVDRLLTSGFEDGELQPVSFFSPSCE